MRSRADEMVARATFRRKTRWFQHNFLSAQKVVLVAQGMPQMPSEGSWVSLQSSLEVAPKVLLGSFFQDSSSRIPPLRLLLKESFLRIPLPGFHLKDSSLTIPPPGFLLEDSWSSIPLPGFLLQDSSSRIPPLGFLLNDSSLRIPCPGFLLQDSSSKISPSGFLLQDSC